MKVSTVYCVYVQYCMYEVCYAVFHASCVCKLVFMPIRDHQLLCGLISAV